MPKNALHPSYRYRFLAAFTLIELSIVLVILGLLTGAVLGGRDLIKAASLRKTLTFNTNILTEFATFRDKYQAYPGDMPNATSFWDRSSVGAMNCAADPGTASATGTCNGDGNGYIKWNGGLPSENFLVWDHLRLAGLEPLYVDPIIPGVPIPSYVLTPGQTFPSISFIGGDIPNDAAVYAGAAPNGTDVKGIALQSASYCQTAFQAKGAAASPETVWQMDIKVDDGIPASGRIRAWDAYTDLPTCLVRASGAAACLTGSAPGYAYNVLNTDNACAYLYVLSQQ